MRSFCVVFLVLSLTPAFAQQETGGNTGATTGTAQGNQAVQGSTDRRPGDYGAGVQLWRRR